MYFRETEKGSFEANLQATQAYENYDTSTTSYAGFGRLTAHLTDQLRLVGGVRYTSDNLGFGGATTGLTIVCMRPSCPTAPLLPFTTSLAAQTVPYPPANGAVPLGTSGAIDARNNESLNAAQTNDRATYRGAIEYDVAPRSLAYASVETGYRSGGFNIAQGYSTYAPEYITAYTVGSKNRLFENRLELNAELFIWKYTNQQITHLGSDVAGNQGNITQNIGRSTNQGAEFEVRYLIAPATVLTANIQYLDARYDQFSYQVPLKAGVPYTGCAVSGVNGSTALDEVNCSGKPSFNAPKYTLDLGIEHAVNVGDYKLVAFVNTQYIDSRFIGFSYQPAELAPSVWHTNAQLTLSPNYDKWSVSLFTQNLENNRYPVNDVENPISELLVSTTAAPRIFGVRASTRF